MSYISENSVFYPICFGKLSAILTGVICLIVSRRPLSVPVKSISCIGSGFLDAIANAFFLLGRHNTRLDIAVVLVSLYPIFTILLSRFVLKELISKTQWMGILLALIAIVIIIS